MPDISMCMDDKCPSRRSCRRHEASGTKPSESRQAYMGFARGDRDFCDNYYPAIWPILINQEPLIKTDIGT